MCELERIEALRDMHEYNRQNSEPEMVTKIPEPENGNELSGKLGQFKELRAMETEAELERYPRKKRVMEMGM
jgi:hypothetical protein